MAGGKIVSKIHMFAFSCGHLRRFSLAPGFSPVSGHKAPLLAALAAYRDLSIEKTVKNRFRLSRTLHTRLKPGANESVSAFESQLSSFLIRVPPALEKSSRRAAMSGDTDRLKICATLNRYAAGRPRHRIWKHPSLILGTLLTLLQVNASTAADMALKVADKEPPKELHVAIRAKLQTKAVQLLDGGKPVYEFWFGAEVPLQSKPAS